MKAVEGELSKSLLENNKCYLLDCGSEVFVWVGRVTQVEDRKAVSQTAEVVTCICFFMLVSICIYSDTCKYNSEFFPRNFLLVRTDQNQHE